jgi:hypothetical protein
MSFSAFMIGLLVNMHVFYYYISLITLVTVINWDGCEKKQPEAADILIIYPKICFELRKIMKKFNLNRNS